MSDPKAATWIPADALMITTRIDALVRDAKDFSPFEAAFLTELLRMAKMFHKNFRMTPKQFAVLEEMERDVLLPGRIAAKIRKPKVKAPK